MVIQIDECLRKLLDQSGIPHTDQIDLTDSQLQTIGFYLLSAKDSYSHLSEEEQRANAIYNCIFQKSSPFLSNDKGIVETSNNNSVVDGSLRTLDQLVKLSAKLPETLTALHTYVDGVADEIQEHVGNIRSNQSTISSAFEGFENLIQHANQLATILTEGIESIQDTVAGYQAELEHQLEHISYQDYNIKIADQLEYSYQQLFTANKSAITIVEGVTANLHQTNLQTLQRINEYRVNAELTLSTINNTLARATQQAVETMKAFESNSHMLVELQASQDVLMLEIKKLVANVKDSFSIIEELKGLLGTVVKTASIILNPTVTDNCIQYGFYFVLLSLLTYIALCHK